MPLCHFGALSISASFPLFYAAHEPILTEPDGLDYRRHSVVRWQLPVAGEQQQVGVGIVVHSYLSNKTDNKSAIPCFFYSGIALLCVM